MPVSYKIQTIHFLAVISPAALEAIVVSESPERVDEPPPEAAIVTVSDPAFVVFQHHSF